MFVAALTEDFGVHLTRKLSSGDTFTPLESQKLEAIMYQG